ncbi:MAG: F0F1 ATP synthase subunit epsilon [Gammaproteobacteria bacterium]|nr:F0F1 ATP synthase subunit epsilon [Gammaproteobacteria bacterium]
MPFRLQVDIVSAEAQIFSGKAEMVVAPSVNGELGILPHHAPLLARLKPGMVRIVVDGDTEESVFVSGGLIEVQPHVVTILADTARRSRDLDEAAARTAKERIEKELGGHRPAPADYARLKAELDVAIAIIRSLEHLRDLKRRR